ncbi:MAG: hypothetical protein K2Y40_12660 [Reyranella sp.]|nr:hypothetical protein [Reyranella sp.]
MSNGAASVSLTIQEKESRGRPFLSIDADTLKKLGWKPAATLQLSIGTGEDDGKIRIEPMQGEPTSLSKPSTKGKRCRVVLGRMPGLAEDEFKSGVAFEFDGSALIVSLPDKARGHRLPPGTARAVAAAQNPFGKR